MRPGRRNANMETLRNVRLSEATLHTLGSAEIPSKKCYPDASPAVNETATPSPLSRKVAVRSRGSQLKANRRLRKTRDDIQHVQASPQIFRTLTLRAFSLWYRTEQKHTADSKSSYFSPKRSAFLNGLSSLAGNEKKNKSPSQSHLHLLTVDPTGVQQRIKRPRRQTQVNSQFEA